MKALTIWQPWAYCIVHPGIGKNIENRTWFTNYRGRLLIHAGKRFDDRAYMMLIEDGIELPPKSAFVLGAIIGEAELYDCVPITPQFAREHYWAAELGFAWMLRSAREYPQPVWCQGKQGLWVPNW